MRGRTSFDLSVLLQAAAEHGGASVTGDTAWVHLGSAELAALHPADRELVHVVTGERLDTLGVTAETAVSFFALQIIADRAAGALADGRDLDIAYVEDVYTRYEANRDGNPFSDELFDLALAYLVGRDLARVDGPDVVRA